MSWATKQTPNLSGQVTARAGPILEGLGILKINRFY